jgi:hypothetical protein
MISPHLVQALVVADRTAHLRAEADDARLARAVAAERRAGAPRPASRSFAAALRGFRGDVAGPSWTAPPVVPSLRDNADPAPGC